MFKGIIFDFYGTLVNSENANWKAAQSIFSQLPIPPMQAWQKLGQFHHEHILSLKTYIHEKELFIQDFRRLYKELNVSRDPAADYAQIEKEAQQKKLFSDTLEALTSLGRRFPMIIAANSDNAPFRRDWELLNSQGGRGFTSEMIRIYKPDPEFFHSILFEVGLNPEDTVHIGDSFEFDIVGAKKAGMPAIWVNRHGVPLPDGGPEPMVTIRSLSELIGILL